jgi:hypothetical protein
MVGVGRAATIATAVAMQIRRFMIRSQSPYPRLRVQNAATKAEMLKLVRKLVRG